VRRTDSADSRLRNDKTIPGTAKATASPSEATPITAQVVQALVSGKTPRIAAQDLGLPLDFVNLVIEQARISGDIDFFELRTENCTAGGACQPDPESMVRAPAARFCRPASASSSRRWANCGESYRRTGYARVNRPKYKVNARRQ
jgi:hypothetical protein